MHKNTTWSHDHVVCLFDYIVCFKKGIPHGWDYFHPHQNVVHTNPFYKNCFDMSKLWKITTYHNTMAKKDNQMLDWCMRLRPQSLCSKLHCTRPSVSCDATCGVWPHTLINHLGFVLISHFSHIWFLIIDDLFWVDQF